MTDFVNPDGFRCDVCANTGLPPGNLYDPQTKTVVQCSCWPERVSRLAVGKANIHAEYLKATFDTIMPSEKFPNQGAAIETCRAYAQAWPEVRSEGRCLSILGREPGMGKSHLASAVCHHLISTCWTRSVADQDVCLFVNVAEWFESWREHFMRYPWSEKGSTDDYNRFDDPAFKPERDALTSRDKRMKLTELLVLDDLTKFSVANRDLLQRVLALVEHRVSRRLPIVMTDNAGSMNDVSAKLGPEFGPPITDRFVRNGDVIVIEAPLVKKSKKKSQVG